MKESLTDATIRALTEGLHRNNIKAIKKVESKIQENYAIIDDASGSVLKKFNTKDEAQNAINTEVPEKYRHMYNVIDMSNVSDKDNITDIPEQYVDKLYIESVETTTDETKLDNEYTHSTETKLTETKSVSDYKDDIDLIIALESDNIKISTVDELNRVKAICEKLKNSQGFYGRLLNQLNQLSEDNLPIIL